jgi:hypothetical protein
MGRRLFDMLDADAVRQRAAEAPPAPAAVTAFLGRLTLLHGAPFAYLVADARLLPPESLKLFLIDARWLDALVGGALSVGPAETARLLLNKARAGNYAAAILAEARAERARRRGATVPDEPAAATASGAFSGFLLRSHLLEAWPGIEARAFRSGGRTDADEMAMLRLDRVGPDILFGVVDGQLAELELTQPPEGLHFAATADAPRRDAAAGRVLDVRAWADGAAGSAALADRKKATSLRVTYRIGG